MYTIGEFSKITMLTVKALRYYDEQGILKPAGRGENDYRLYSEEDFARARQIALLRSLGFGIAELRDVMQHCESEADLQYYLAEKRRMIGENIKKETELMEQLQQYLHPTAQEDANMEYRISIKQQPALRVLSVSFEGRFEDMGAHMGRLYKAARGQAAGPPLCLYHDADFTEKVRMQLCLPVKPGAAGKLETLPAARLLCTTHTGSYETLNLAYKALMDDARARGLRLLLPWREEYRKGPGMVFRGNPAKYVTEIQVPFEEENP